MNSMMDPPRERLTRWAVRGALILAAVAAVLGTIFNIVIGIALRELGPETTIAFWAWFVLRSIVAWAIGASFFGAILGAFASMIWRYDSP